MAWYRPQVSNAENEIWKPSLSLVTLLLMIDSSDIIWVESLFRVEIPSKFPNILLRDLWPKDHQTCLSCKISLTLFSERKFSALFFVLILRAWFWIYNSCIVRQALDQLVLLCSFFEHVLLCKKKGNRALKAKRPNRSWCVEKRLQLCNLQHFLYRRGLLVLMSTYLEGNFLDFKGSEAPHELRHGKHITIHDLIRMQVFWLDKPVK